LNKEPLITNDLSLRFYEITKGFSERRFKGKSFFVKHIGLDERAFFDYKYQHYYQYAIKRGIPSEEEALQRAKKNNDWSDSDETEIEKIKDFLSRLALTKKNLFKKIEIQAIEDQEVPEREKLFKKTEQRKEVLGKTAESYATNRSNDYVLYETLFLDRNLKDRVFQLEEFEDLTYEDLYDYIIFYNEYSLQFSELNIQKIALSEFFYPYFLVLESPNDFWGKPMIALSDYQARLMIYGKVFKNIFEQNDNIPESIKKDPEALFAYVDKTKAKEKFESKAKKRIPNASGEMVFNASKDELPKETQTKALNSAMKEKKSMAMEDLMKLHGEM
jgi:hypothetical protein